DRSCRSTFRGHGLSFHSSDLTAAHPCTHPPARSRARLVAIGQGVEWTRRVSTRKESGTVTGAESRTESGALGRLGFRPGQVVIEYGYDDDVDETFREQVEDATASPLEDEDFDGVVDAVLLWWRDGDGDLGDDLMDAIATLE